jgi:sigma-B regulation protein RsbU (phosphoserine phosphatase)
VCRRLRAAPATKELPIMFLSSLEDSKNKAQGFEAGGNDYLTKPFDAIEARARVRSLLRAKAYADAVKEAAARELAVAREIQTAILPADPSAAVEGAGVEVAALVEPAKEVGGDLYDVQRAAPGRVAFALGDVSGKGVPAALLMAVTTTLFRSTARQQEAPEEIVMGVNRDLVGHTSRGLFVTLFCGVYDVGTRRLSAANAGHLPAVRMRPGTAPELVLSPNAPMVGVFSPYSISRQEIPLEPGDTVVVYSDGITEAFDADRDMFGEARLLAHLARDPGTSARATVDSLLAAVRAHAKGAPQSDDISLLALRVL